MDRVLQAFDEGWIDGLPHAQELLFIVEHEDLIRYKSEGLIQGCISPGYRIMIPIQYIAEMEAVGLFDYANPYIRCVDTWPKILVEEECEICMSMKSEFISMCQVCKKTICRDCMIHLITSRVTGEDSVSIPCPFCRTDMIPASNPQ